MMKEMNKILIKRQDAMMKQMKKNMDLMTRLCQRRKRSSKELSHSDSKEESSSSSDKDY